MHATTEVNDQIGRTVKPGDWIAYGVGRNEVTTGIVLGFQDRPGDVWDTGLRRWVQGIVVKIQVKSPSNERPSLIEARRKQFLKIEAREAGAEFGERNRANQP